MKVGGYESGADRWTSRDDLLEHRAVGYMGAISKVGGYSAYIVDGLVEFGDGQVGPRTSALCFLLLSIAFCGWPCIHQLSFLCSVSTLSSRSP